MKISVVIPAYNEESRIGACLESIFAQEVPADEVIVVNNNSKDKTAEIARQMGAQVIDEKNQGITWARNRGFDEAQGDIIARCDADVLVPKDWIKKIHLYLASKKVDGFSGPLSYYDSKVISASPLGSKIYLVVLQVLSGGRRYLAGPNMILTKAIWEKVREKALPNDAKVHEDVDLSIKIHQAGGVIGYEPTLLVKTSARRIVKKPTSFFVEYPARLVRTFWENR